MLLSHNLTFKKASVGIIEDLINGRRVGIFKIKGLGQNGFRVMENRRG